jgi:hypothetical protein
MRIMLLALAGLMWVACSGATEPQGPVWPVCEPAAGGPSLAEKAARFDRVAREEHLAPDGLLRNLTRTEDLSAIQDWHHVENVILWSGMYLASQAFRYAVTAEPEAQANAAVVLAGLGDLTRVTGVTGLYGRSLDDPSVAYNYDGRGTSSWTDSTAAGYEGWAFRNDVSKDGYAGLMFGYAAALEHFDDPALLAGVRARLAEIAGHLMEHGLQIFDTDGLVTEHGALYHSAFDDFPGFNAMLASSFIKVAQVANDDAALDDFYYGCLMRLRSGVECPDIEVADLGSYIDSMESHLYLFQPNCKQNYDNFDMCYQAIYPLLRRERHDGLRARLQDVLRKNMFHTDDPRYQSMAEIGWAFFTYSYAALLEARPGDDPILDQAVELAACTLAEFPEVKFDRPIPEPGQPEACRTRLDTPAAAEPIPLAEYRFDNYLWRLDPFEIPAPFAGNQRVVFSPEDFLVAYWLGRLHGLLGPRQ